MTALDTDHVTVLQRPPSARRTRFVTRMADAVGEEFCITLATVEEQMRGWLATIAKERQATRQVKPYSDLGRMIEFFAGFTLLPFDETAARHFDQLRPSLRRLGTMDLKIACCSLSAGVLLLTANCSDFGQIPGLRIENWLDQSPPIRSAGPQSISPNPLDMVVEPLQS